MKYVYVVAATENEALALAEYGSETRALAEAHLRECQAPPTDPFYGSKLRVYKVPAFPDAPLIASRKPVARP